MFYPFPASVQDYDDCFSPFKASWIGTRIVETDSGVAIIFNKNDELIEIHTQAQLDDEWTAYQNDNDGILIKAG
ncbi:MAG: hypothetical protein ACOC12_03210 [Bacteroidota bacterium]